LTSPTILPLTSKLLQIVARLVITSNILFNRTLFLNLKTLGSLSQRFPPLSTNLSNISTIIIHVLLTLTFLILIKAFFPLILYRFLQPLLPLLHTPPFLSLPHACPLNLPYFRD
jgi:hypothetical protein